MSRNRFYWLLFATALLAILVLVFPGRTGRESGVERTVLLPGLAQQVNDVAWFQLTGAGGETIATLKRTGDSWVVEEAFAYRADWSQVKTLLTALSRAEVIEQKTSNPEYYARLGVEEVNSTGAGGVMVEFAEDSGLPSVIIGNPAQGRSGQYARLSGSAASVLIDTGIDLPGDQSDWLDKAIIDIPDTEVVEVRIEQPDGQKIQAARQSADDDDFILQDVPGGREIKSEWSVNSLANGLAALDLQAVVPAAQFNWDGSVKFWELTADGLAIEASLLTIAASGEDAQEEHWIRFDAGLYTTAVGTPAGAAENPETAARADEINDRVAGWAYQIPGYRFDTMTQKMEDLLQAAANE